MALFDKITYCPPPFEEIQHDVTVLASDKSTVLECSFHSDVSLMMRIQSLSLAAKQVEVLKDQLQPLIDSSNYRSEFEDTFGKLTDDELIKTCPSRYLQTQSEQMRYLKELASKDIEVRKEAAAQAKDQADKEEYERQEKEFRAKFAKLFGE
jgi:uncharacterized membrane protein YcgQ (UPF0703/DUF1980 family)